MSDNHSENVRIAVCDILKIMTIKGWTLDMVNISGEDAFIGEVNMQLSSLRSNSKEQIRINSKPK